MRSGIGNAPSDPLYVAQTTPAGTAAPSGGPTDPVNTVSTSSEYETVAASQTAQVLGGSGAIGDRLACLWITPATTSPGNVILLDGAISYTVFAGGASSVSNLVPFPVYLDVKSVSGAWKVTTGTNVSVFATGDFT